MSAIYRQSSEANEFHQAHAWNSHGHTANLSLLRCTRAGLAIPVTKLMLLLYVETEVSSEDRCGPKVDHKGRLEVQVMLLAVHVLRSLSIQFWAIEHNGLCVETLQWDDYPKSVSKNLCRMQIAYHTSLRSTRIPATILGTGQNSLMALEDSIAYG